MADALSRLTTAVLREVAHDVGLEDTGRMSRYELLVELRAKNIDGRPWERRKTRRRSVLGRVVGIATKAAKVGVSVAGAIANEIAQDDTSVTKSDIEWKHARVTPAPPLPAHAHSSNAQTTHAEPTDISPRDPAPMSSSKSPPKHTLQPSKYGNHEEPFPTRTMAQILAKQGQLQRARSIYMQLIASDPHNTGLRDEAETLNARIDA